MTFYGGTDTGLVRQSNQDQFEFRVLSDRLGFAVVCDGMGGQNGGNVASEMTTRFVCDMLGRDLSEDMSEVSLRGVISAAVSGANALVYDMAVSNPDLEGMGTTLIIAVLQGSQLYVAFVGDSRVYTASPTRELQLTKDHTVVQMLLDIGEISPEDAESHPKRHYITRAVGVAPTVNADFLVHTLAPDELVLLCSDGLYHYLEAGALYAALHQCVREKSADSLIQLAKDRGGADNITVVVAVSHE